MLELFAVSDDRKLLLYVKYVALVYKSSLLYILKRSTHTISIHIFVRLCKIMGVPKISCQLSLKMSQRSNWIQLTHLYTCFLLQVYIK